MALVVPMVMGIVTGGRVIPAMDPPEWLACKVCGGAAATCRSCRTTADRCIDHLDPKEHIVVGGHAYCVKTRCTSNIHCAKCKAPSLKHYVCAGVDGYCGKITDLCPACGDFKYRDVERPSNLDFLCPECMAVANAKYTCKTCSEPYTKTNKGHHCDCCGKVACAKCDPTVLRDVDISPITLHGSGLSVARCTSICGECRPAKTKATAIKIVQDAHKHDRFRCPKHSTLEFLIEHYPWIVCSKYESINGNPRTTIVVLNKNKTPMYKNDDPSPAVYDMVDAYCTAHPEKHVRFDGKKRHFPIKYTLEKVLVSGKGEWFAVTSQPGVRSECVWYGTKLDKLTKQVSTAPTGYLYCGLSHQFDGDSGYKQINVMNHRDLAEKSRAIRPDGTETPLELLRQSEYTLVNHRDHIALVQRNKIPPPTHYVSGTGIEIKYNHKGDAPLLKYPGTTEWVAFPDTWAFRYSNSTTTLFGTGPDKSDLYLPGRDAYDRCPVFVIGGDKHRLHVFTHRSKRRKVDGASS